jgi:hypothetical protein
MKKSESVFVSPTGFVCEYDERNDEIAVRDSTPAMLVEVHIGPEGTTVKRTPLDLHPTLKALAALPLFRANNAGSGKYNIDLDCGAQRWNGIKPRRDVVKALRRCGFSLDDVRKMLVRLRGHCHEYISHSC